MNEKRQIDLPEESMQNDPTAMPEPSCETQEPVTAEETLQNEPSVLSDADSNEVAETGEENCIDHKSIEPESTLESDEAIDPEIDPKIESEIESADEQVALEPETACPEENEVHSSGGMRIDVVPKPMNLMRLIFGILCAVLVFGGGIFLGLWLGGVFDAKSDIDPDVEDYDGMHADQDVVAQGSYSAPGYAEVTLPAGKKNVKIVLPNPVGNPCYLQFTLVLTEQNEVIYRSGLIPPGKAVSEITLTRALKKGTYQMEIRIEAVTLEDKAQMNGVTMNTVLTVK